MSVEGLEPPIYDRVLSQMLFLAGVAAFATGLLACGDPKTVSYYLSHSRERESMVSDCVAYGQDKQDCQNAKQAEYSALHIPAKDGVPIR
jgi:hypothetical protein